MSNGKKNVYVVAYTAEFVEDFVSDYAEHFAGDIVEYSIFSECAFRFTTNERSLLVVFDAILDCLDLLYRHTANISIDGIIRIEEPWRHICFG